MAKREALLMALCAPLPLTLPVTREEAEVHGVTLGEGVIVTRVDVVAEGCPVPLEKGGVSLGWADPEGFFTVALGATVPLKLPPALRDTRGEPEELPEAPPVAESVITGVTVGVAAADTVGMAVADTVKDGTAYLVTAAVPVPARAVPEGIALVLGEERGEEVGIRDGVESLDETAEIVDNDEALAPRDASDDPEAEGVTDLLARVVLEPEGEREESKEGEEVRVEPPTREDVGPAALGEPWEALGVKELWADCVPPGSSTGIDALGSFVLWPLCVDVTLLVGAIEPCALPVPPPPPAAPADTVGMSVPLALPLGSAVTVEAPCPPKAMVVGVGTPGVRVCPAPEGEPTGLTVRDCK